MGGVRVVEVEFETNYWRLYPVFEPVCIEEVRELGDGVGLKVKLRVEGEAHYRVGGGSWRELEKPWIRLEFGGSEPVKRLLEVKVEGAVYRVRVGYYPRELYERSGQRAPGYVILHDSDIPLCCGGLGDWVVDVPEGDRLEAERIWGRILEGFSSDYDRVRALARAIIGELEPHRGIPSDEMERAGPLEQYRRAVNGVDRVWCSNIAGIFAYACNCFGFPARVIRMVNVAYKGDYWVLLAEGHSTVEVYSRRLGQWFWLDPTLKVLGAFIGDVGPLNLVELYMYVNMESRLKHLSLVVYDPESGVEERVPALGSGVFRALRNYFKREQRFFFRLPGSSSSGAGV